MSRKNIAIGKIKIAYAEEVIDRHRRAFRGAFPRKKSCTVTFLQYSHCNGILLSFVLDERWVRVLSREHAARREQMIQGFPIPSSFLFLFSFPSSPGMGRPGKSGPVPGRIGLPHFACRRGFSRQESRQKEIAARKKFYKSFTGGDLAPICRQTRTNLIVWWSHSRTRPPGKNLTFVKNPLFLHSEVCALSVNKSPPELLFSIFKTESTPYPPVARPAAPPHPWCREKISPKFFWA
jgi:hypothetical protein